MYFWTDSDYNRVDISVGISKGSLEKLIIYPTLNRRLAYRLRVVLLTIKMCPIMLAFEL